MTMNSHIHQVSPGSPASSSHLNSGVSSIPEKNARFVPSISEPVRLSAMPSKNFSVT